jgi:hypothetical protein
MAAAFAYAPVRASGAASEASFEPASGRPSLLLFADPSCMACDAAVRELEKTVDEALLGDLSILVVTTEPDLYMAASEVFRSTTLPLARVSQDVARAYRVDATPFVYGVGADGSIRAHAVPRSARDFEAMAHAARTEAEAHAEAAAGNHSTLEV